MNFRLLLMWLGGGFFKLFNYRVKISSIKLGTDKEFVKLTFSLLRFAKMQFRPLFWGFLRPDAKFGSIKINGHSSEIFYDFWNFQQWFWVGNFVRTNKEQTKSVWWGEGKCLDIPTRSCFLAWIESSGLFFNVT